MLKFKYIRYYCLFSTLFFSLTSCQHIGVENSGNSFYVNTAFENQILQSDLTLDSKNFLTTNALDKEYQSSPKHVIELCLKEINKKNSKEILEHNFKHSLKVMIELCINEAQNCSDSDEAIKYWLTACYLSYRYLYNDESNPPNKNLIIPDNGIVQKYYNYTLYKIFNYLQNNNLINSSDFQINVVSGSVKFNKPVNTMPWKLDTFKQFGLCYNYKPIGFNETIFDLGAGLPIFGIPSTNDYFEPVEKWVKVIKYLYPCNFALKFDDINAKDNKFSVTPYYFDFYRNVHAEIEKNKIMLSNCYTSVIGKFVQDYPSDTEALYFFNPGTMAKDNVEGIYMLEPFNKKKIPILFIHGLISDPQSMAQIVNTLMQSNIIRENFQFWFYFYPTGQAIIIDTFILRKVLQKMYNKYNKNNDTKFNEMVVVGYSLGGLIAQLLIQDSEGDKLEKQVFFTELKKLNISKNHKNLIENMLNFKPLPFVKETIFISTPHHGAEMASWVSAQIMGDLVTSPSEYYEEYKRSLMFISKFTREHNASIISGNSLDNLSPSGPFMKLTKKLPYSKNVKIHSIIGDLKQAGNIGGTDGVVPYASSHLDNAESETVIKSNHHAIYKPACAKKIFMILFDYLNSLQTKTKKQQQSHDNVF